MAKSELLQPDTLESVEKAKAEKKTTAKKATAEKKAPAKKTSAKKEEAEAVKEETPAPVQDEAPEEEIAVSSPVPTDDDLEKAMNASNGKKAWDDMTDAEKIAVHVARSSYSVQKASREDKKDLYKSEKIFVEAGDDVIPDTDAKRKKEEWLELVASAEDGRILKGTISSVTEVPSNKVDEKDYVPEYMAKVNFKSGQWNIYIPSYVLYYYNYRDLNRAMASDILKNMGRRIGAEIDFCVRFCDERTGVVYGDRLQALSMRGSRYYLSNYGRKPEIIPGMIVQAKIIAVAREYITVDAAGAEIRIPLEEISWLFISDAREFDGVHTKENYKPGERVNVKILTIEEEKVKVRNSNYTLIKATGSIRQAQPNPRNKYYDDFHENDIYAGTVTGINESGVYVNLDNKIDCLCKFPRTQHHMPILGENVVVKIIGKDDEKKYIFGVIR